jgi:hypothetical protein
MSGNREALWNTAISPDDFGAAPDKYRAAILEQYKLCVTMADNVSARRNLTNTFFLTLNSVIVAALAGSRTRSAASIAPWAAVPGLVILLAECLAWFAVIESYQRLNTAKFAVIVALEERLPAFAYAREWGDLGAARGRRRYTLLTRIEQSVPVTFAVAYAVVFVGVVG